MADVTNGKYKGERVIVLGTDRDVWDGTAWFDMQGNISANNYAFRMGKYVVDTGIDAYKGVTYACDLGGKSILFHESQLNIIGYASRKDIEKNLEDGRDRVVINVTDFLKK